MTVRPRRGLFVGLIVWGAAAAVFGVAGCSSKTVDTSAADISGGSHSTAPVATKAVAAGAGGGKSDLTTICPKLPVSDAQALISTKLAPAVVDDRLGGCTFVLPGNQLADSNLTVVIEQGGDAAERYTEDVNGTFVVGDTTTSAGPGITTPLSGIGDKAVWGSPAGYPEMSALKGDVYCSVSTADDATQLTIIGSANNPLPQGTQAQQTQYAELEGKLCADLFGLVH
jgi:hypothetical protein